MVRLSSVALLPLAAAAAVSAKTSLFLSPVKDVPAPISVDFEEASSILSHHFDSLKSGVVSAKDGIWDHLLHRSSSHTVEIDQRVAVERLFDGHQDDTNRLLVLMHGADQNDVVPQSLQETHKIDASPTLHHFDALLSDYMDTFSQTLSISESAFSHLGASFVNGVSAGVDWVMGHSSKATGDWAEQISHLESAAFDTLRSELQAVHTLVEQMQGKQATDLSFQPLRFSGLESVKSTYGAQSEEYLQAKKLVASAIEQVTSLFQSTSEAEGRKPSIAFVVTDGSSSTTAPFVKRSSSLNNGPAIRPAKSSSSPIAKNLLATCFTSKSDLEEATNGCSGHGSAIQTSRGGKKCYRCQCTATKDKQSRKTYWAGAACQKKDVSTEFFLLGSSVILLVLITLGSVYFLFAQGSAELPGTLASVTINLK